MKTRILLGSALIILVGVVIWVDFASGRAVTNCLILLFAGMCAAEYCGMSRRAGATPLTAVAVGGGLAVPAAAWAWGGVWPMAGAAGAALAIYLVGRALGSHPRGCLGKPSRDLEITAGAIAYVGVLSAFIVLVRISAPNPEGLGRFLFLITVAKGGDMAAYFGGTLLGVHKLSAISPKKTVEGAVAGLMASGGLAAVIVRYWPGEIFDGRWRLAFGLGMMIGLVAQAGDLLESALKRRWGVKDSATLIPSFGGFLDIADSILLAAPLTYWVFSV